MAEWWVVQEAEEFWRRAGGPPPFPRTVEDVLGRAHPLEVLRQPGLSAGHVARWVRERGWWCDAGRGDQRLRGCLLAWQEIGLIFLDSTDPPDEQRYTLAHEVAHFLADYLRTRREAVASLGRQVLEVLDGWRAPTRDEQVHALLAGVRFGLYLHLAPRDGTWGVTALARQNLEARADKLALELLAPAEEVRRRVGRNRGAEEVEKVLRGEFGLPEGVARVYARRIAAPQGHSLVGHLRAAMGEG